MEQRGCHTWSVATLSEDEADEEEAPVGTKDDTMMIRCTCRPHLCYTPFLPGGPKEAIHKKCQAQFSPMHKMDQDQMIFDHLRCKAIAQGFLQNIGAGKAEPVCTEDSNVRLKHSYCDVQVCRSAYVSLMGIGSGRYQRLRDACMSGQPRAPVDLRYLQGNRSGVESSVRAEIYSFLQHLYNTVAEVLPEDGSSEIDAEVELPSAALHDVDPWVKIIEIDPDVPKLPMNVEQRFLPPGSVYELWRQFKYMVQPCGYRVFYEEYKSHFHSCMKFRETKQHAVCSTCTKYKLLIRNLAHDTLRREEQTRIYFKHLKNQDRDRKVLAQWRAQSREQDSVKPVVLIEIDAVDQAKMSWPRSRVMTSKEFAGVARPRLHVTGAIVHGYFKTAYVTEADRKKDSNFTCQVLAHILTRLKETGPGLDPRKIHLRINMDNTCRENKNQKVMRFGAWLVATRRVDELTFSFLRTGHTHELIDQWLGRMCKHIWHRAEIHTPLDFVTAIGQFALASAGPYEKFGDAFKVDQIRDWSAWLQKLGVGMSGHGGPTAVHEINFRRRGGVGTRDIHLADTTPTS